MTETEIDPTLCYSAEIHRLREERVALLRQIEILAPIDAHGLVRHLLCRLPFPDRLPAPEIVVEEDGDLGLDWCLRPDAVLSVSLSPVGVVSWSALVGDHKSYGHFTLPAMSEDFTAAMTRLGQAA